MRIIIFIILFITSNNFIFSHANGIIQGIVLDANTRQPFEGANIILKELTIGAITDKDGSFYLKNVPFGNYKIIISHIGYESIELTIEVSNEGVNLKEILLIPLIIYEKPFVVTANRIPLEPIYINKSVEVIGSDLINTTNANSIEGILHQVSNIDVKPRGIFGVQANVGIRGSLFSQNLILLNGVRINDPQTAHHNFNIPVSVNQIERIEILKGPGSTQYGPDAFGGIINIVTKEPEFEQFRVRISVGENKYFSGLGSYETNLNWISTHNSFEMKSSSGYRYDTDFKIWNVSSNNFIKLPFGDYNLLAGYIDKEFGAYDFYTPGRNYPSKEWTNTGFVNIRTKLVFDGITVNPKVYYRRNYDKFMLDLRTPHKFVNIHTTHLYGGEIVAIKKVGNNIFLTGGFEYSEDKITSTKLGDHNRSLFGYFINAQMIYESRFNIDVGIRVDHHLDYGVQFNPTVGLGYLFSRTGKIFLNSGRAFRAPSYTELYYSDPVNVGNAELKPEIGWSYELGFQNYFSTSFETNGSVFLRKQSNIIDYVQYFVGDKFYAENFTKANTSGAELSMKWTLINLTNNFIINIISIQYNYLDSKIDHRGIFNSKYNFTHPRHQINSLVSFTLPFNFLTTVSLTQKYKLDKTKYTLFDLKTSKNISSINVFIDILNLFNKAYEEIKGVPLPGRWIILGFDWVIKTDKQSY